jgi:LysM repeat protein
MLTASVSNDIKPVENYSTDVKPTNVATASTLSSVVDESIYKKEYFVYIIKAGDSLESISKMFPKNTIGMIKNNNNISSNAEINRGSTLLLEK